MDDDQGPETGLYDRRDRITAALIAAAMIFAAVLMADIAADGRVSAWLDRAGPAEEAERIAREAVS